MSREIHCDTWDFSIPSTLFNITNYYHEKEAKMLTSFILFKRK